MSLPKIVAPKLKPEPKPLAHSVFTELACDLHADREARNSAAAIDDDFARDIEEGIKAHRQPWNPASWE